MKHNKNKQDLPKQRQNQCFILREEKVETNVPLFRPLATTLLQTFSFSARVVKVQSMNRRKRKNSHYAFIFAIQVNILRDIKDK